ncbi:unnamed protein product [Acanthosepion pharaonis]|uniref:TMEM131L fifth Ig-like domain-containing protein n=1 Tax=Acanthosepion pharaonis TaxID=158019 RepID=A0A812CXH1_ACAPH|nr:unnamed protein product [Sepia pharaonis]
MRFSNRKAGSQAPLPFEMTEKHLKNCDKKRQGKNSLPHFTVKRMFTMRNTGELPFYVHGFSINSSPCEGYGFKVLDCIGFELPPNGSQKIDIAFTPDFTMSRIRRVLTIFTSLGPPMNYTLQATVPPYMLAKCAAALPRPSWEMGLYYAFLCIIIVLTVCVFIAAYFEAKRICVADSLKRKQKVLNVAQLFEKGKAFDLKNITGLSSIPSKTSLSSSSSSSSSSLYSSSSSSSSSSSPLPASSLPSPSSDSRCSTRSVAERSDHHADHSHHRTNKRWTFKTVIYLFKKLSSVFYISSSAAAAAATTATHSTANATPTSSNTATAAMANSNPSSSTTATTTNKKSNNLIKANMPEKDSRDLHVQNNLKASNYEEKNSSSSGHHHHHHHHHHSQNHHSHHHQDDATERSSSSSSSSNNNSSSLTCANTTVHRSKKTRASKRYHNDLNSNSTDTNDRRILSEKNTDSGQQKKMNYDKNFASFSTTSSGSQDDYKNSHNNCSNSSRRVSSEDQRNNDDQHNTHSKTDVTNVNTSTAKGKNKKKKNKTDNKEQPTKSRFSSAADEKDETSSTTTESSTGDPEEKACSRESSLMSTPQTEPARSKNKKSKTVEKYSPILEDISCVDDDFELTTKSKAHKKVKVNPKEAYGGNILKPSTLELPYNLENKKSLEKKEQYPLDPQMSCKMKKLIKQSKGKAKTDGAASRPAENDNMGKYKDLWDTPHVSPSGDLSDLASQTENFALQHSRPYSSSPIQAPLNFLSSTELSPPPPPPSAPLSASSSVGSRSSSYSSVVSNNNLDTSSNANLLNATHSMAARKTPTKPCTNTPMTTAAPTAPENWTDFNLFADHGLSAPFSTRTCQQPSFSLPVATTNNPFDQPYFRISLQNCRLPSSPVIDPPSPLAMDNQPPSPHPFSAPAGPMSTSTSTDMNLFSLMDNAPRRQYKQEEKVTSGDSWLNYPPVPSPPISENRWVFNSSLVSPLWRTSSIPTSIYNSDTMYDRLEVAHIWEPNHTSPPSTAPGSHSWNFPGQPNDN